MKSTIIWVILLCILVTVFAFDTRAESASMANLVEVTIVEKIIKVTIVVVLHLAIVNVLDGPDLQVSVSLAISVVEGFFQGADVGRPGRHLAAGGGNLQHRDAGDTWAGSVERRGEAWRRARRCLHP